MHITVVVVDDFPLMREGLAAALDSDPGIQVVGQAADAEEALDVVRRYHPDVVLLDMRLPGTPGTVALKRLREEFPDIRVLVVTASEKVETMLEAVSNGAAGYVTKRLSQQELRDAVITVHGGGSVVSPRLASELLREYAATSGADGSPPRARLTDREREVLALMSHGLTDQEIGDRLFISRRTVQNQLATIRQKTGLKRRSELARWAAEHTTT